MNRLLASLDRAPLYWIAVGLGLLVFSLNRQVPEGTWSLPVTEQSLLDTAFIEVLRTGDRVYEMVPDAPQTFGSHLLPQLLVAAISLVTGDAARAGIWLSLVGVIGVLTGLYLLAIRIYPLRGFALATVLAAGALGTLHTSLQPDPSAALGMALVVWGMAFFLTALTERQPYHVFASGLLFGLAGYIRIELSLIWIVLTVYLLLLQIIHGKDRKTEPSAVSMALGGLVTVLLLLWPLVHRNVTLAGTPVLPGYDAELILGAPVMTGEQVATPFMERFAAALHHLTLSGEGPGVFPGLLWPLGMVICLFMGRHKKLPYFWIPVLVGTLLGMTALGAVTGEESTLQTLRILSPVLLPFALLPLAFVVEQILKLRPQPIGICRWIWAGAAVGFFALIQLPHFLRSPRTVESSPAEQAWLEDFTRLPAAQQQAMLVSDRPGPLVSRGKRNVIGTRGQTDWTILAAATAGGGFRGEEFLRYLRAKDVELLHIADPENPLIDRLKLVQNAPVFTPVDRIRPPHRLYSISWP